MHIQIRIFISQWKEVKLHVLDFVFHCSNNTAIGYTHKVQCKWKIKEKWQNREIITLQYWDTCQMQRFLSKYKKRLPYSLVMSQTKSYMFSWRRKKMRNSMKKQETRKKRQKEEKNFSLKNEHFSSFQSFVFVLKKNEKLVKWLRTDREMKAHLVLIIAKNLFIFFSDF